eukprot:5704647-Ditylum_brightwellii.AAC.1
MEDKLQKDETSNADGNDHSHQDIPLNCNLDTENDLQKENEIMKELFSRLAYELQSYQKSDGACKPA